MGKKLTDEKIEQLTAIVDNYRQEERAGYTRFIVVDGGPALKARKAVVKANEEAFEAQKSIAAQLGAHSIVNFKNGWQVVMFPANDAKRPGWKQAKLGYRGTQFCETHDGSKYLGWVPDGTNAGKANQVYLNDAPKVENDFSAALDVLGLPPANIPILMEGNRGFTIVGVYLNTSKKLLIKLPWRDVDKKVLKAYNQLAKNGNLLHNELQYLSWEVPKDQQKHTKDIRESEFYRLIEKHNDKVKAEKVKPKKAAKKEKSKAALHQNEGSALATA
jgi:hypothetical protein